MKDLYTLCSELGLLVLLGVLHSQQVTAVCPFLLLLAAGRAAKEGRDVNVTTCLEGFGYPEWCPRPEDPANHTRCCRHYHDPTCCEQRASRVCASANDGLDRLSGWEIDPDVEYAAIFCPQPGQSDLYTSCAYTRDGIGCFNRNTAKIIIYTVVVVLVVVAPGAFVAFMVYSMYRERKDPEAKVALPTRDIESVDVEDTQTVTAPILNMASKSSRTSEGNTPEDLSQIL